MIHLNKLSNEKRTQVIAALVEGNSMLAVSRITGVAKNTVSKLLADIGEACARYQDEHFRKLKVSAFSVTKSGRLLARRKRIFDLKKNTFLVLATFTRGLQLTRTLSLFLVGI